MILLHDIVEILDLSNDDGRAMLLVIAPDGRRIGLTPVNGDLFGHAVPADGLGQKALGSPLVPLLGQQKVNRLASPIHRTVQVLPLAFDTNVRLIEPPAHPHGPLAAVERLFQLRTVLHDPPVDRGVIDVTPRSSMSSSTWRVLNGYATYQRTQVRMTSLGKWAPLKLTAIVALPLCTW